jgi:hypothetical protein
VELLGAYSMIEHLFVTSDGAGQAAYTPMGRRHVQLVDEYRARIGRSAEALHADCRHFAPVAGGYSPYAVLYGFSSNLLEHMALKALQPEAVTRFSLEDVFVDAGASADKREWISGWRKLPHLGRDLERLFEYPQQFAEHVFARIEQALRTRARNGARRAEQRTGRLLVVSGTEPPGSHLHAPALPLHDIRSSDAGLVAAARAESQAESALLGDRREGRHVISYRTTGGWLGISKDLLTDVLAAGQDATVSLPADATARLLLMCPTLVTVAGSVSPASAAARAGGGEAQAPDA